MTQRKAESVEHQSAHPLDDRIEQLKRLFPEVVNEDGIDGDALRNLLGLKFPQKERYNFTWAGKQDALLSLQQRSQAALKPVPEESLNWESTGHAFVEGDNLEVLKLLYKSYFGRVKMIYIDPPYNTGNDFIYPDDFSDPLGQYLRVTGQVDESGRALTSKLDLIGRKHSGWLSMMYPRLFLARQLLRDDGMIFISIDDNEVNNLRMLMNEVFGEENFIGQIIWKSRQMVDNRTKNGLSSDHEYVIVYGKSIISALRGSEKDLEKFSNPDNDPRGPWRSADLTGLASKSRRPNLHYDLKDPQTGFVYECPPKGWRYDKETMRQKIQEGRVLFPNDPNKRPRHKLFQNEMASLYTGFSSVVNSDIYTSHGTKELSDIFGIDELISFPKPSGFVRALIEQLAEDNDTILDFFAGSASTAQAVLELNREDAGNRRFIMVQLPEPTGSPNYPTIAEIGKERIRRVIARMQAEEAGKLAGFASRPDEDLGFRVFRLDRSAMRQWEPLPPEGTTPEEYAHQLNFLISDPLLDGWTVPDIIAEVALKEAGFGLNYTVEPVAEVTGQQVWRVADADRDQRFYICLDDRISLDALRPLALRRDDLFVFRDSAVTDTVVANLALTCRIKSI